MSPAEMIVAIVSIGCGTGVAVTFLNTIRARTGSVPSRNSSEVVDEIRALRDDVRQLRSENSAAVLNLDQTLDSLDQRISRVETRGQVAEGEYQRVGR